MKPVTGLTHSLRIFSGEVRATSSISMPPAAEATKPMRSAARSTVMER
jgi:hypothetical protein